MILTSRTNLKIHIMLTFTVVKISYIVTCEIGSRYVGCRTAAAGMHRNANTSIFRGHTTINGMHRCLIRANSYYQLLGRQYDITDTYLYFVCI